MFYQSLQEPLIFTFLVVDDLSLMGLASAVDALRSTNRLLGREAFVWRLTSLKGNNVKASNGIMLEVSPPKDAMADAHAVFVCSSIKIDPTLEKHHIAMLRQAANRGLAIGSLSTGSQILAKAGLLDGYRCTIHWENIAAFEDEFPNAIVTRKLYEIDRNRLTCSGGSASMDMMLHIVAERYGEPLARAVANQFHHERIRNQEDEQRSGDLSYPVNLPAALQAALSQMKDNIESPLKVDALARALGISVRQLERLFGENLAATPSQYYLTLRLDRGRELLLYTDRSVLDIAIACGFGSTSHFAHWFRRVHGSRPNEFRKAMRAPSRPRAYSPDRL